MRRLLRRFRDAGGDGIEVCRRRTPARNARSTRRYARVFGLLASTGSDFHGPGESPLDLGALPPLPAGVDARVVAGGDDAARPRPARTVFFLSDRTGITAEMLGNSLLTQFEEFDFRRVTIPFVDSPERVAEAIRQVNETAEREGRRPIVISSVVDEAMSEIIRRDADALTLDLFQVFIQPLEAELGAKSSHAAGTLARHRRQPRILRAHGGDQLHPGARRRRDDARPRQGAGDPGRRVALRQDADVALPRAAVRRSRRQFSADARRLRGPAPAGVDDAASRASSSASPSSPSACARSARSGGRAASTPRSTTAAYEVREAEALMTRERIAMLDTTTKSIEEIATTILHRAKLQRHIW